MHAVQCVVPTGLGVEDDELTFDGAVAPVMQ